MHRLVKRCHCDRLRKFDFYDMQFSDLNHYDYHLPPELIRREGVEPRDSARLFVYDTRTDTVFFDIFRNIGDYLPENSLLVLNDTRVLPARLWLTKETGGKIEVFVLANQIEDEGHIPVLVDRKTTVGQKLFFPNHDMLEVVGQDEQIFFVHLESSSGQTIYTLLEQFGQTPLPHYLEGAQTPEHILRKRYQTIFADTGASVAAPTASLHFTETVFDSLKRRHIQNTKLTLDVGRGTFAPLSEENFATQHLHTEHTFVPDTTAAEIQSACDLKKPIIAVGTTVARTLESRIDSNRKIRSGLDRTSIFIFPPYQFRVVDHLITNFHLPKTSLLLLVDALLSHKKAKRSIMDLYLIAKENHFSFYSFGDSMLIL